METKISFGFKKLAKKPGIIRIMPPEEKKVELIECLDQQSIKIKGHVEVEEKPLVIPMQGASKSLLDRIKEANELKERSRIKYTKKPEKNGVLEDTRPDSELTIDELAARKLLEEAKNYGRKKTTTKVMTIAIEDQLILEGAQEPTMDDYESVPISDYGYAMLRGMGWSEEQTVDKKRVETPSLRPKGMGLGASVPGNQTNKIPVDKNGKELKLVKNAKAKIIAGKEKGNYCIVQGLDDDAGRVVVKTTISGTVLSLNEFMLFPVSDEEYTKSAKVLNNAKFEKYSKIKKGEQDSIENRAENGEIEYVPNKSDVKIVLSSESEGEKEKYKKGHRARSTQDDNTKTRRTQIKLERRSRSISKSRKRNDVSRENRNPSRDNGRKQQSSSKERRSRSSSESLSRSRSTNQRKGSTSRNTTNDRSRSNSRNKKNTSQRTKSGHSTARRHKHQSSEASDDDHQRRLKKAKSKKKHKKEKRHKNKKKSKRYSSSSDSGNP